MVWLGLYAGPLPFRKDCSGAFARGQPWGIHGHGSRGTSSHSLAVPFARKRVRSGDNVGSLPNSSSTLNQTCFFSFPSTYVGVSSHHALLLDSWDLGCRWRLSIEQQSLSSVGWDHGGLREGDWHRLQHWGEGLWHHTDLSLPLEWEHHLLKLNHPVEVSSLSCLADSIPWDLAEGVGAHEMEWPWEHLLPLKEGLAVPVLLCSPALVIHLVNSWHSSLIDSFCCLWGSTLGATLCSSL